MSQAGVVTRLALRELWITFRLVVLLVAFVAVGAVVALLPAPLPVTMERLAVGLAAATLLVSASAAWSIAEERAHGRAGWLVTRSVARGTLLGGWFVAVTAVALAGLAAAGVLGWLAANSVSFGLQPGVYAGPLVAIAATVAAAAALGLLCGTVLGPMPAALASVAACAVIGTVAQLAPTVRGLPGAAFVELASVTQSTTTVATAWQAAGGSLLVAAVVLGLARLSLARAEL